MGDHRLESAAVWLVALAICLCHHHATAVAPARIIASSIFDLDNTTVFTGSPFLPLSSTINYTMPVSSILVGWDPVPPARNPYRIAVSFKSTYVVSTIYCYYLDDVHKPTGFTIYANKDKKMLLASTTAFMPGNLTITTLQTPWVARSLYIEMGKSTPYQAVIKRFEFYTPGLVRVQPSAVVDHDNIPYYFSNSVSNIINYTLTGLDKNDLGWDPHFENPFRTMFHITVTFQTPTVVSSLLIYYFDDVHQPTSVVVYDNQTTKVVIPSTVNYNTAEKSIYVMLSQPYTARSLYIEMGKTTPYQITLKRIEIYTALTRVAVKAITDVDNTPVYLTTCTISKAIDYKTSFEKLGNGWNPNFARDPYHIWVMFPSSVSISLVTVAYADDVHQPNSVSVLDVSKQVQTSSLANNGVNKVMTVTLAKPLTGTGLWLYISKTGWQVTILRIEFLTV